MKGVNLWSINKYEPVRLQGSMATQSSVIASRETSVYLKLLHFRSKKQMVSIAVSRPLSWNRLSAKIWWNDNNRSENTTVTPCNAFTRYVLRLGSFKSTAFKRRSRNNWENSQRLNCHGCCKLRERRSHFVANARQKNVPLSCIRWRQFDFALFTCIFSQFLLV